VELFDLVHEFRVLVGCEVLHHCNVVLYVLQRGGGGLVTLSLSLTHAHALTDTDTDTDTLTYTDMDRHRQRHRPWVIATMYATYCRALIEVERSERYRSQR